MSLFGLPPLLRTLFMFEGVGRTVRLSCTHNLPLKYPACADTSPWCRQGRWPRLPGYRAARWQPCAVLGPRRSPWRSIRCAAAGAARTSRASLPDLPAGLPAGRLPRLRDARLPACASSPTAGINPYSCIHVEPVYKQSIGLRNVWDAR